MRRLAIGSIAIVLLAGLQCEPQETKVAPLKSLRQTAIVVEPLDADTKTVGLSRKSLESQMLVGLRRDIPGLAVRESARPFLYLSVTVVRETTVGGQELGFSAFVSLEMIRPVWILEDVGVGEVTFGMATVWDRGGLLVGNSSSIRQQVKESIDEKLTAFAADYYRQNPFQLMTRPSRARATSDTCRTQTVGRARRLGGTTLTLNQPLGRAAR